MQYIRSNKALVNKTINGYQVTAYKVTHGYNMWFYSMAILKDGKEVWNDSISFDEQNRVFWSASASCQYPSARKLVLDVAGHITNKLLTS